MKLSEKFKIALIELGIKNYNRLNILLNEKNGANDSLSNLTRKFNDETIKYKELEKICDDIGLEIKFVQKEK